MASSLQRPALRATAALSRFPFKTSAVAAGAGASVRASMTTTAVATYRTKAASQTLVAHAPTALTARHWNCQRGSPVALTARRSFWSDDPPQGKSTILSFEEVKKLVETPDSPIVIVDAREPAEIKETGRIPGAINIPIGSRPDSFFYSDEDFENRFGFRRPEKDTELLFYCKAGVRSRTAAELARVAGWVKTYEFPGSWKEWAAKGGPVQR